MSIRAYKIIKLETKQENTFNCWHDQWIMDMANLDNYSDGGFLVLDKQPVEKKLKKLLSERKRGNKYMNLLTGNTSKTNTVDDNTSITEAVNILKNIIKDMGNDDCVQYSCY